LCNAFYYEAKTIMLYSPITFVKVLLVSFYDSGCFIMFILPWCKTNQNIKAL